LRKKLMISLIGLIMMWSCTDGDLLSDNSGQRIIYGTVFRDTLIAFADTSIVEGKVSTAIGLKLLLGSYADFDARFLIKFTNIPSDTIKIDSLRLMLTSVSNQGDMTESPMTGSIYLVSTDWNESVNAEEDWDYKANIDYAMETTTTFEILDDSTGVHLIDLPTALMDIWQDTIGGSHNFGLLVDFDNTTYMKEFSSDEGATPSQRPKLIAVHYDIALDSTFHDTLFVESDASLIDFNGSFDPQKLNAVSGYSVYTFLTFDLDSIPLRAAMATMDLILKRDTLNSVFNNNKSDVMYLRTVSSDYDLLPYYTVDSTFSSNIFYSVELEETSDNILSINPFDRGLASQSFFQDIINGNISYGSFLLHYRYEGDDIAIYSIKDSSSPNIDDRPKLILEYYLVPEARL
jgi:hypothetical protein